MRMVEVSLVAKKEEKNVRKRSCRRKITSEMWNKVEKMQHNWEKPQILEALKK